MCLANSLAMRLANVSASTAEIEGGEIVRYANGTPTGEEEEKRSRSRDECLTHSFQGIFKDRAMELINAVVPPLTSDEEDR
jgi:hypothetical protein